MVLLAKPGTGISKPPLLPFGTFQVRKWFSVATYEDRFHFSSSWNRRKEAVDFVSPSEVIAWQSRSAPQKSGFRIITDNTTQKLAFLIMWYLEERRQAEQQLVSAYKRLLDNFRPCHSYWAPGLQYKLISQHQNSISGSQIVLGAQALPILPVLFQELKSSALDPAETDRYGRYQQEGPKDDFHIVTSGHVSILNVPFPGCLREACYIGLEHATPDGSATIA
ncbi:uncharacterized protein K460DRAFT_422530 [Cucurbitaria berberidis CBS 394.84]|uniref:Uncharacterized protein n=1 Tax=Cucurbitaria berberidis CBS 394.84 TaxID=1168544 RepID=A0A9P4GQV2_9PLEO|nr:uncharacterized protein K460DRAFT_422530 [Cucurbitaria berberidis CBS 394.84]KAF1850112.1 hypothetical protein K460DRAFT_422530 [Cucurbitaria berberidis CBS 394.84]